MEKQLSHELYELEKIRFIIKDACGLDVAYAYDDLVFAEHGLFIIQFLNKQSTQLACWFNAEVYEKEEIKMFDSLAKTATLNNASITYKGRFCMKQKVGTDEIDIEFVDL
jgi:hypothetical protein